MDKVCVSLKSIEKLFPFLLVLNDSAKIEFIGKSMKKLAKNLEMGTHFNDKFKILKPHEVQEKLNFEKLLSQMTVIQENTTQAKFMGQWIRPSRKSIYAFIGSLSVTDPMELKNLGLDFGDFPIQDQIFDFLMLTQTQKRSITEADIANRKLAVAHEIAVKASETKSQFLANMSHELRTPMNGVLGMASVLKDGTILTEEQKGFVDDIIQSGESMLALINDILDLTKVEAGLIQLNFDLVSVEDVIQEVISVIHVSASSKGNVVKLELEIPKNQIINTDPLRLRQILLNIVGNANKFTNNGSITIKAMVNKKNENQIQISVSDTGIGMNSDVQKRIFSPFVQGDSSLTKKFGGTGLGLSISKKLVEALGGSIRCQSQEGIGSYFEFEINLNLEQKKEVL